MNIRVTVSLPAELVKDADRVAKRLGAPTRSAAFARALEMFLARARDRDIDASLDAYYGGRPAQERAEERGLVRAMNRSQRRRDLDDEGR
jgi:hypothetical protein